MWRPLFFAGLSRAHTRTRTLTSSHTITHTKLARRTIIMNILLYVVCLLKFENPHANQSRASNRTRARSVCGEQRDMRSSMEGGAGLTSIPGDDSFDYMRIAQRTDIAANVQRFFVVSFLHMISRQTQHNTRGKTDCHAHGHSGYTI